MFARDATRGIVVSALSVALSGSLACGEAGPDALPADNDGEPPAESAAAALTTCEAGVSAAPCQAVGLRTVVVAQDGSGQYREMQPALNAARPGDNILIKPGTYANTGTVCGSPFIVM